MRKNVFALSLLVFFVLPAFAHAALVNINTADEPTLDALPYISATVAQAIIDYRNANGPFATIEDIMNVKGIKSGIFSDIQSLITVGDTDTSETDNSNSSNASSTPTDNSSTATSTTTTTNATDQSSSGGPAEYLPIPALRIVAGGDRTISSNADVAFTAAVYDNNGNKRDDAIISWSFGDGMQKTGASVFHAYYDPGEYVAVVHASTSDGGDALAESTITVEDAGIKIASVSARGIALANNDTRTLDLSLWRLSAGGQEFIIPENTEILAGDTVLFPSQVIELPVTDSATLLYPSGEIADTYPEPSSPAQLSSSNKSSNTVQAVDPIISTNANIQKNEEAVSAPAAATELAAAGAALPPVSATSSEDAESTTTPSAGLFHSPWTFGFLGVVIAAGGAFVLL
jgi:competence protein ComEA